MSGCSGDKPEDAAAQPNQDAPPVAVPPSHEVRSQAMQQKIDADLAVAFRQLFVHYANVSVASGGLGDRLRAFERQFDVATDRMHATFENPEG